MSTHFKCHADGLLSSPDKLEKKKNYVTLLDELIIETYFLQAAKLIQNKVWKHFDKTIESAEK